MMKEQYVMSRISFNGIRFYVKIVQMQYAGYSSLTRSIPRDKISQLKPLEVFFYCVKN